MRIKHKTFPKKNQAGIFLWSAQNDRKKREKNKVPTEPKIKWFYAYDFMHQEAFWTVYSNTLRCSSCKRLVFKNKSLKLIFFSFSYVLKDH